MPKSRKRRPSNYQRVQARNRRDAVRKNNYDAVMRVYDEADPRKQEYKPETAKPGKPAKLHESQLHKPSRVARVIEIPRGGLRDGTRVRTLDGVTYTSVRGGLVRARQTTLKKRAA